MADDYLATTATTGRVAVGGTATGQLEIVGDRDWFSIVLAAGNQYSFKLDPAAKDGLQDPYLRLFGIGGATLLAENDDANGLGSQIDISIVSTGTYYLEAGSGTNPEEQAVGTRMGNYVLSASTSGDDYTANASTTGRITAGGSATGQLETAGDSDWFATSLLAGKEYVFTLKSGSSSGLADPMLALYGSNGALLASNDDSDGLNSLITFTATTSGTYYLGASSGVNGGGTGSYTLDASLPGTPTPPAPADDYSANVATTGSITAGGSATGQLEATADSDWFAIALTAGKQYIFTLTSGATDGLTDPLLSLYASNGALVTSNDDTDGLNSAITITAATSGTYYLAASSGPNGGGTGSYVLNASLPITDDYGATTSTSGRVVPGGAEVSGQVETTGDADWFAINLTSGQEYTFTLNAGATNGLPDPFLSLYGSSGTLVTSDDDSHSPNAAITYTATTTGTYFLGASSSPRASGSATGSYTLSASLPNVGGVVVRTGSSSADTITAGASDESIDGGLGIDTIVFSSAYATYSVTAATAGFVVAGAGASPKSTLTNVERLQFSDAKLAIDMGATQSGGEVALLMGAVLGKASLANKPLIGQLLPYFDAGNTMKDAANVLISSGIMTQLAGGPSTSAYVNMIYKAVVGEVPTADTTAILASVIDNGTYSKADFLTVVTGLPLNQTNVDLVGLQQTGLAYL